jgi:uncharacterized protein
MSLTLFAVPFLAGSLGGFLSGILGIGGGTLMFPLLLYLPPILGLNITGIKSIYGSDYGTGFFACLSAKLFFKKQRLVHKSLVFTLGLSLFLSSLSGAIVSKAVSDQILLFIFGALSLIASVTMLIPRSYSEDDLTEDQVGFNKLKAVLIGIIVGFLLGPIGQGGAFTIIPILLYLLKVPLRLALGSTLAIGLFS